MMNLPIFFADNINDKQLTLNEDTSKHVIQVLRMKQDEQLQLTDGKGNKWLTTIVEDHKKKTIVEIVSHTFTLRNPRNVTIAISLTKNNSRFEWFLEKATELGISEIIPLLCERTEKQHFRYDRMKGILVSAMLQSQQIWMPELREPVTFSKIASLVNAQQKFIAHCEEDKKSPLAESIRKNESAIILIGPEGDFTPAEIALAKQHQFVPVSLGDTRLRVETAGVVVATLLQFTPAPVIPGVR